MKDSGYRVVVIGSSSLLGKELVAVLEERRFPTASLKLVEDPGAEPELPFVDLAKGEAQTFDADAEIPDDFDFAFVAASSERLGRWRERLKAGAGASAGRRFVIDLSARAGAAAGGELSVPFLDHLPAAKHEPSLSGGLEEMVSPHTAAIMISALLLRLATRFALRKAVAQIFSPASEIGPRAIEELQKQTVNLLSFQKLPREVFGGQIAFNLLPRLGAPGEESDPLAGRIRRQLQSYLGDRVPMPALRLFQVPVFYSIALSLYVETEEQAAPADLVAALGSAPLKIRRGSQKPPSQVEAAGSNEILVDAIELDAACPWGVWLWAVADNLRLTALNAVQVAEGLLGRRPPLNLIQ